MRSPNIVCPPPNAVKAVRGRRIALNFAHRGAINAIS